MRISEVCKRTGLTERTIRYYEEEGLISPEKEERGGRIYRNYSEQEVSELETISSLRKLLFSVEEIKTMKKDPASIPGILSEYRCRLVTVSNKMNDVISAIERLDIRYVTDITSLAKGLKLVAARRSLPAHDITPNFSRIDILEGAEAKSGDIGTVKEKKKRADIDRGEKMVAAIITVDIAGSFLNLLLNFGFGNIVGLTIVVLLAIGLYSGRSWVQIVYVIVLGLNIFFNIYAMIAIYSFLSGPGYFLLNLFTLGMIIWRIICIIWLTKSESVNEYLKYKR